MECPGSPAACGSRRREGAPAPASCPRTAGAAPSCARSMGPGRRTASGRRGCAKRIAWRQAFLDLLHHRSDTCCRLGKTNWLERRAHPVLKLADASAGLSSMHLKPWLARLTLAARDGPCQADQPCSPCYKDVCPLSHGLKLVPHPCTPQLSSLNHVKRQEPSSWEDPWLQQPPNISPDTFHLQLKICRPIRSILRPNLVDLEDPPANAIPQAPPASPTEAHSASCV